MRARPRSIGHGRWLVVASLAASWVALAAWPARALDAAASPREQELLTILRTETPEADKAIACKRLAMVGSPAAVGDLAALLTNERLASWARIALEAIPGPEADAALRKAAESLSGRLVVGVINSIGVRRDSAAIGLLEKRLADADAEVAVAAAAALGKVGSPEAATILARALAAGSPDRDAVAEASVVAAERLLSAGRRDEALAAYDAVWKADLSEQRRAEAARGAILARGAAGIPLLVELVKAPSKRLFNMGLSTARELGAGPGRDQTLAEEVDLALLGAIASGADGRRAALVIDVLADRSVGGASKAVQAALLDAAAAGPMANRVMAIRGLGRVGDAAVVPRLLAIANEPEAEVASAALDAVAVLPGEAVDGEITARLTSSDAKALPAVVAIVGRRRIPAVAEVVTLTGHDDTAVRAAAIRTLGAIVDPGRLDVLVKLAAAPRDEAEAEVAAGALAEAAVRMADRDACADRIAAAIAAGSPRKAALLEIVGAVGGPRALAAVDAAARSGDPALADAATRLLGKWMTPDAADVLLALATSDAAGSYRGRTLKGYIRIARQFVMPEAERAAMCRKALAAARDAADRKAVIEILVRYPHAETLAVAKEALATADVEAEAKAAVAAIEAKLPGGAKP
jgi:HEAT repeat protein